MTNATGKRGRRYFHGRDGTTSRPPERGGHPHDVAAVGTVTINSSTGAWDFYTSTDGSSWSALGTTQTPAPGDSFSVYDGTALVIIGVQNDGTSNPFAGKFYRAQILDGIGGTVVFDANFANPAGSATFTEDSANYATVTLIEPAQPSLASPGLGGKPLSGVATRTVTVRGGSAACRSC